MLLIVNDLNSFACDQNYEISIGSGQIIDCNLLLGKNTIILEITDKTITCQTCYDCGNCTVKSITFTVPHDNLGLE